MFSSQHKVFNFIFIVVYGLLHFKSIGNVSQLNFGEETTPQSSRVLESSTLFDRQKLNLSTFVHQENFFVVPKRFKSEKQLFMQESGYDSSLISKDKNHKNLPLSPFLPGANSRVHH